MSAAPAPRMPQDPSQLDPGDCWVYVCHLCELPLQRGWPGTLAHFRTVHPDHPAPLRPHIPEPPQARLTAVEAPPRPETPPKPRKRHTRTHTPSQDALFDLTPEDTP